MDNRFNEIVLFFSLLNCEFSPGNRLIDVMRRFGHGQFLFSDFIGILFSFSFSFLLDDEEARDNEVT